jgi:hypothetical protein
MAAQHTFDTSAGPLTVEAAEPVPGLHIYKVPDSVSVNSPYRWILAHHDGRALASFETAEAANAAAKDVAPFADWTRNAMTAANEIGPGGMQDLLTLLRKAGGQHPNA